MGAEDDDIEWTGPFAFVPRPLSMRTFRSTVNSVGVLYLAAAAALVPIALSWVEVDGTNIDGVRNLELASVAAALFSFAIARVPRDQVQAWLPFAWISLTLASVGFITAVLFALGPELGVAAIFFVELPVIQFIVLRRGAAVAGTVVMLAAYALALSRIDATPAPAVQWLILLTSAVATGVLVGRIANRLDDARRQLGALNRRFRRFLAPQVADALTDGDGGLAPHRTEIAVFFVDLRGFTAFTNTESAERVVDVLAEYYAAVGTVVHRYGGTIGGFDGDGVFAFLGDPTPNPHAAADALAMAKEVASALDAHTTAWGLGYGIGLAYGEATVGLVGFEGRLDYTPVGACVNLAARLCTDAKSGEIVIDDALREAAGVSDATSRDAVDLKGFGEVATYAVSR